jgi:hypothetical protein
MEGRLLEKSMIELNSQAYQWPHSSIILRFWYKKEKMLSPSTQSRKLHAHQDHCPRAGRTPPLPSSVTQTSARAPATSLNARRMPGRALDRPPCNQNTTVPADAFPHQVQGTAYKPTEKAHPPSNWPRNNEMR